MAERTSKYPFPYDEKDVKVTLPDNGKKLGGTSIMTILEAGWYQIQNRKDRGLDQQAAMEVMRADPEYRKKWEAAKQTVRKRRNQG